MPHERVGPALGEVVTAFARGRRAEHPPDAREVQHVDPPRACDREPQAGHLHRVANPLHAAPHLPHDAGGRSPCQAHGNEQHAGHPHERGALEFHRSHAREPAFHGRSRQHAVVQGKHAEQGKVEEHGLGRAPRRGTGWHRAKPDLVETTRRRPAPARTPSRPSATRMADTRTRRVRVAPTQLEYSEAHPLAPALLP